MIDWYTRGRAGGTVATNGAHASAGARRGRAPCPGRPPRQGPTNAAVAAAPRRPDDPTARPATGLAGGPTPTASVRMSYTAARHVSTTRPERTDARPKNRAGCGRSPSLPAAPIGSCGGKWEGVTLQGFDSASPPPLAVAVGGGGSRAAAVTGVAACHQVKTFSQCFSRDRGGAHEPDRRCGAARAGRETEHWAEEESTRRVHLLGHHPRTRVNSVGGKCCFRPEISGRELLVVRLSYKSPLQRSPRPAGPGATGHAHFPFVISSSNHEEPRQRARLPCTTCGGTGPTSVWSVARQRQQGPAGSSRM